MRSLSRAATALGLAGFALAIVIGAVIGVGLGASASEPGTDELSIDDPALAAAAPDHAKRSPAGFTGFGSAALSGEVIAGGELQSVEADDNGGTLVFSDDGRTTSIRYLNNTRLFELIADADLLPGDTVVMRFEGNEVVGILRISPELSEDAEDS